MNLDCRWVVLSVRNSVGTVDYDNTPTKLYKLCYIDESSSSCSSIGMEFNRTNEKLEDGLEKGRPCRKVGKKNTTQFEKHQKVLSTRATSHSFCPGLVTNQHGIPMDGIALVDRIHVDR